MSGIWEAHFSKGLTSARPAANTLPKGAIYWSTDDKKFYVGSGPANTWADFTAVFAMAADLAGFATESYADAAAAAAAAALVDSAPGALNTLNELAAALADDPSFATTMTTALAAKAPVASPTFTGTPTVPDDPYDATTWDGNAGIPTKNAIRDKIETLSAPGGSGAVVQVKNFQTGAVATGSTLIPHDDTIPQNTEGNEYMTLAITPTSATNKLRIDVNAFASASGGSTVVSLALFQDATANALAATAETMAVGTGGQVIALTYFMTAGTTSATTFKVRAGGNGGSITFNGQSGARRYGGVCASSITITEIVP